MFRKKQKKVKPKYKTPHEIIYGNMVLQKLKEIRQGRRAALFVLLFVVFVAFVFVLIFLALYFANSGQNVQEIISR